MRPARIITTAMFAAAIVIAGCSSQASSSNPAAAPRPTVTAAPESSGAAGGTRPAPEPAPPTSPTGSPGTRPAPAGCAATALQGSVAGSDGAAGHIWYTIQLRNASSRTCTLRGIPGVRLLGDQGQPVTAPSRPDGPAGSLVTLRRGRAAQFELSEPNACDGFVEGSRLRVTLPQGQSSLVVPLDGETRFGTCASVRVRALQAPAA